MTDLDERRYEERYNAQAPPPTCAQAAATRVYCTGGVFTRNDPFVGALDRNGNGFQATKWHDPNAPVAFDATRPGVGGKKENVKLDVVTRFRNKILDRMGSGGIQALGRIFRIMDDDRNHRVDEEELQTGLNDYGIRLRIEEIRELLDAIAGGNRQLGYEELVIAVRGVLNDRRLKLIDLAYNHIDRTNDGKVSAEDLAGRFSGKHHPDVMAGRMKEEDAANHFLSMFEGAEKDGIVTKKEFIDYYKNVSASVDDDDYFELMIRNAWHIPGGEGWCANTANTRLLVVTRSGEQKVVMLEDDLGLDKSDNNAIMQRLKAQGLTDVVKFTLSDAI
eukprot:TRINITY_DN7419_c0_g1_i1.p1 TRINITY_DN7419_c0_g1~~TRINITY_DN7419_c0_g1_i1.p1  ORF type:complete len:333 (-),score=69.53 TRINITY_DN7419_c0_g1_i1:119-1117(-)